MLTWQAPNKTLYYCYCNHYFRQKKKKRQKTWSHYIYRLCVCMRWIVNHWGEGEVTTQRHRLAQSTWHFTALHSQIRAVERKRSVTIYEPGEVIIVSYVLSAKEDLLYISVSQTNNLRGQEQPERPLVSMMRTEKQQV